MLCMCYVAWEPPAIWLMVWLADSNQAVTLTQICCVFAPSLLQMCRVSMQPTAGVLGWAHRMAGTQFIPGGLAYLNCCSQQLGECSLACTCGRRVVLEFAVRCLASAFDQHNHCGR